MRWCRAWSAWEDWFQHIPWNIYWFQHISDWLPQVRQPCWGFSGTVTCKVVMVKYNLYPLNCQRLYSLPTNEGEIAWVILTVNEDFPGGSVVKNLPCNVGDTDSIPGSGRSHMSGSNWALAPQLLSLFSRALELQYWALHAPEPRLHNKGSHHNEKPMYCTRESPRAAMRTQHSQQNNKQINKCFKNTTFNSEWGTMHTQIWQQFSA